MKEFTIMVASHRRTYGDVAMQSLGTLPKRLVDGSAMSSCSQLWNECIVRCSTERVVICNEKARPTERHTHKLLALLEKGYALVGLYRFGFFGLPKETIRRVGFFDERFVGGHHEDSDMVLRLWEAQIAYYESEEVPYIQLPSSWHHEQAIEHWNRKWCRAEKGFERLVPEVTLPYEIGPPQEVDFLPWQSSVLMEGSSGLLPKI